MADDKLRPCLWFDRGEGRKAATFYASVFPDSRVEDGFEAPDDFPTGARGDELTVAFTVLGRRFLALNGGPAFTPDQAVSFMVTTEDQAETDRYWNAIVENGGRAYDCGWCRDRWGFFWQITPRALMEGMSDPDRAAANRVFAAMMTMQRIDVARIEAARRGEADGA